MSKSKQDKYFESWWKGEESRTKEIARKAFKAGAERSGACKLRLKDLQPGEMFRLVTGRQVYIVCRMHEGGRGSRVFFNAKGNVYDNSPNVEVVKITNHDEFWAAKDV